MAYRHGVYTSEIPTSLLPPVEVSAGLPVVFGTAPVNLTGGEANKPVLVFSYSEAVAALGYSADWKKFTLCEFIQSQFAIYGTAPVVLVNVLDPEKHRKQETAQIQLIKGKGTIKTEGILLDTLSLTGYEVETDYLATFDGDGNVNIAAVPGGNIDISAMLDVQYDVLAPEIVTSADIIGGIDVATQKATGLELVDDVFPRFRLIPGLILAPGWSHDPTVAAFMGAKSHKINGHFDAIALVDLPTKKANGHYNYTEMPAWKNDNGVADRQQIACWPMFQAGDYKYHASTHIAGAIGVTDANNGDIPYVSPSNKLARITGLCDEDGNEIILGLEQANYLNGEGIATAINFVGGWRIWGNHTATYPANTDPKDHFIPVRRMFQWVANRVLLTYWEKTDAPITLRLIDTITDSINIWMNSLTAQQVILGGRVEFRASENATTDLMSGKLKFHLFLTPPSPAKEMEFALEYDPTYFGGLFAA